MWVILIANERVKKKKKCDCESAELLAASNRKFVILKLGEVEDGLITLQRKNIACRKGHNCMVHSKNELRNYQFVKNSVQWKKKIETIPLTGCGGLCDWKD
jgi:hypothetical protein